MATKRTSSEIEKDYRHLRKLVQSVSSLQELSKVANMSIPMIKTTFSKHPIVFERIKAMLDSKNATKKKSIVATKNEEKSDACEDVKRKPHTRIDSCDNAKSSNEPDSIPSTTTKYVVDASITETENLRDMLSKICAEKSKIILT